ncbi:MAG: hypothetical protein HYX20_00140 [Candidatus Yanofskybacteria bacterium]|nr:hypothetical protein [Candidatus Yanofskybacteria bacterium]
MTTLLLLILGSISIVLAAKRYPVTRNVMQKLTQTYTPGTCRSFILDFLIFLPLVGLLVEALTGYIKSYRVTAWFPTIAGTALFFTGWLTENIIFSLVGILLYTIFAPLALLGGRPWRWQTVRFTLYATAFGIFFAISDSLYYDYLNFSFLAPFLGHPEAWGGNHFMWNSGLEVLGLKPIVDTTIPTYQNFWGFWNLLALVLLGPVYIWVMVDPRTWVLVRIYTRLHGLFFGYTEKQTGISALFFERKTH